MFAIIHAKGAQHKVKVGDSVSMDKIEGVAGDVVTFDRVLMISDSSGTVTLGTPVVTGAVVSAEIIKQFKDEKIIVFKKHRRHNYRRKRGHRQLLTTVKIKDIKVA